jgi:UDP-N-acetylglucosamine transferase subunit ALG13
MIFVTVGAQMPFDRLTCAVDRWAASRGTSDVFAQIGVTDWRPAHMDWTSFLDPPDYRRRLYEAQVVITHAGMGTILTALEFGKPIVVLPRRGDLRETRNDHQVGTARALSEGGLITAAADEHELLRWLNRLDRVPASPRIASHASLSLLTAVRDFARGRTVPTTGADVAAEGLPRWTDVASAGRGDVRRAA